MPDDSTTTEDRLLDLLNRLQVLGPGQSAAEDKDMPVTPSQLVLLDWVAESPGCGVREMATGLGLTPPTISVGVRKLEKAGLLERQPNPQDKRSIRLFLTSQGETLYQRAKDLRRVKVHQLLSGLMPQEQETLLDLWGRALGAAK